MIISDLEITQDERGFVVTLRDWKHEDCIDDELEGTGTSLSAALFDLADQLEDQGQ